MDYFIDIVEFATPECDEILKLRYDILRKPLGLFFDENDISQEYDQIHLGCYKTSNLQLVGCLLLKPIDEAIIKMRQVAVEESFQGKSIGRMLVEHSENWAKNQGFEEMQLHARLTAVPFYEKLNYKIRGDIFQEVNIDHYFMFKKL